MAITQILPPSSISTLSERSQECVRRLLAHRTEPLDLYVLNFPVSDIRKHNWSHRSKYPPTRHAAVLVLLYERDGELRVLLTTRAKTLRTHPGQTALPGGGKDDEDETIVHTAVRPVHVAQMMRN